MAWMVAAVVARLLATALVAASAEIQPGDVVHPEIVVPGDWLTDEASRFLFLPLAVPQDLQLEHCKIMSNGESVLVVVTRRPEEQPETNALRKYRLVVEALKAEAGHDEGLLRGKLQTWLETEEDEEVQVRVRAALDSLDSVRAAKGGATPRTVSVPLGLLARGSATKAKRRANIIRETFAVEIPYPAPAERVFVVRAGPAELLVGMPLLRHSLEASGISTGGKAFIRMPVFDTEGELLSGPAADFQQLAQGLRLHSLATHAGLHSLDA